MECDSEFYNASNDFLENEYPNMYFNFIIIGEFPSTWQGNTLEIKLVTLNVRSEEYIGVQKGFESTVKGNRIEKIERVQNPTLYTQYAARKKVMDQTNPPGTQNERRLYHGCAADIVQNVVHQGLNRTYARAGGKIF